MSREQRLKLTDVYVKRSLCYLRMAERFNKLRYANLASDDCSFVLNNPQLKDSHPLNLGEIKAKCDEFIRSRNSHGAAPQPPTQPRRRTRRIRNRRYNENENKENQDEDVTIGKKDREELDKGMG